MSEIKHFFEQYKKLEHTEVVVDNFFDKIKAFEIIEETIVSYEQDIKPNLTKN
jgi:inorganic pyrophosphatase